MKEDDINTVERLAAEVMVRYPIVAAQFGHDGRELGDAGQYLARAIIFVMIREMRRREEWLPLG